MILQKHLFLLVMNNSGSSALLKYISKCSNAVCFPRIGDLNRDKAGYGGVMESILEGQMLFGATKNGKLLGPVPSIMGMGRIWTEHSALLANPKHYNWPAIKKVWNHYWQKARYPSTEPYVFVEKSPTNLLRPQMLLEHFENAHFIIMVRNPYAVVEGIHRRNDYSIERCAKHWVRSTQKQLLNIAELPNSLFFRYEDLCTNPSAVRDKIVQKHPELRDLQFTTEVEAHSIAGDGRKALTNFNEAQISRLTTPQLCRINDVFRAHQDLLSHLKYDFLEPNISVSETREMHAP